MKWLNVFVIIFAVLSFQTSFAIDSEGNWPDIQQQGKLFTLKITPKAKRVEVEVVGFPAAEVKWDDVSLEANVNLGGERKSLRVRREGERFVFPRQNDKRYDLRLRSEDSRFEESFEIKID